MKSEIELVISERITNNGIISFSEYMDILLFHNPHGYYNSGDIFGREGDFITSPTISSLFGASIANEFINLRNAIAEPEILEIGAGDGSLVISIMEHLSKKKALPKTFYIIETSEKLIQSQRINIMKKIPELSDIVKWVKCEEITGINGLIVCNEFFDVLPTERFKIANDKFFQLFVGYQGDFTMQWVDKTKKFRNIFKNLQCYDTLSNYDNYESEINFNYETWVNNINKMLNMGVVFIVDYGYNMKEYFLPDRKSGTLVCIHNHEVNFDPFQNIGLQDVSSFVNFSYLAYIFKKLKLEVSGYLEQSKFLINLGILDVFEERAFSDEEKVIEINKLKNLILSNAMGDIFKALIITKNYSNPLLASKNFNRKDIL